MTEQTQDDATAAVEKVTNLRGASAQKVAYAALAAGGDGLRAEHAARLVRKPDVAVLGAAVGALALDLFIFGAIATGTHPRVLRPVAAAAVAARAGLFAYSQYRQRQLRERVNAGLAAGGLR